MYSRLAFGLILAAGFILLAGGSFPLGFVWLSRIDPLGFTRFAKLRPIGASELARTPVGSLAVAEGRIAGETEVRVVRTADGQERAFVAFEQSGIAMSGGGEDADVRYEFSLRQRVTPPIVLDIPEGRVRIEGTYAFHSPPQHLEDRDTNHAGALRFEGFARGDAVVACGIVVAAGADRALDAETIDGGKSFRGLVEDETARVHDMLVLGSALALTGLALAAVGGGGLLWLGIRGRHRQAESSAT